MDTTRKKAKIIMLPTKNKAKAGDFILIKHEDGSLYCGIKKQEPFNMVSEEQHLYVVTNDPIQDNDWFMSAFYSYPIKYTNHWRNKQKELGLDADLNDLKYHKIVATNDKSLIVEKWYESIDLGKQPEYFNLPNIPQSFIQKYCELGGIEDIEVEISIRCKNFGYENCDNLDCKGWEDKKELIVNSDNTINIFPIKESWSREDVVKLLKSMYASFATYPTMNLDVRDNWIKENLK